VSIISFSSPALARRWTRRISVRRHNDGCGVINAKSANKLTKADALAQANPDGAAAILM
jgi:hypothetical protein